MGKKDKRKARKLKSLAEEVSRALGAKVVRCGVCGKPVNLPPIDSWAKCECGSTVYR